MNRLLRKSRLGLVLIMCLCLFVFSFNVLAINYGSDPDSGINIELDGNDVYLKDADSLSFNGLSVVVLSNNQLTISGGDPIDYTIGADNTRGIYMEALGSKLYVLDAENIIVDGTTYNNNPTSSGMTDFIGPDTYFLRALDKNDDYSTVASLIEENGGSYITQDGKIYTLKDDILSLTGDDIDKTQYYVDGNWITNPFEQSGGTTPETVDARISWIEQFGPTANNNGNYIVQGGLLCDTADGTCYTGSGETGWEDAGYILLNKLKSPETIDDLIESLDSLTIDENLPPEISQYETSLSDLTTEELLKHTENIDESIDAIDVAISSLENIITDCESSPTSCLLDSTELETAKNNLENLNTKKESLETHKKTLTNTLSTREDVVDDTISAFDERVEDMDPAELADFVEKAEACLAFCPTQTGTNPGCICTAESILIYEHQAEYASQVETLVDKALSDCITEGRSVDYCTSVYGSEGDSVDVTLGDSDSFEAAKATCDGMPSYVAQRACNEYLVSQCMSQGKDARDAKSKSWKTDYKACISNFDTSFGWDTLGDWIVNPYGDFGDLIQHSTSMIFGDNYGVEFFEDNIPFVANFYEFLTQNPVIVLWSGTPQESASLICQNKLMGVLENEDFSGVTIKGNAYAELEGEVIPVGSVDTEVIFEDDDSGIGTSDYIYKIQAAVRTPDCIDVDGDDEIDEDDGYAPRFEWEIYMKTEDGVTQSVFETVEYEGDSNFNHKVVNCGQLWDMRSSEMIFYFSDIIYEKVCMKFHYEYGAYAPDYIMMPPKNWYNNDVENEFCRNFEIGVEVEYDAGGDSDGDDEGGSDSGEVW